MCLRKNRCYGPIRIAYFSRKTGYAFKSRYFLDYGRFEIIPDSPFNHSLFYDKGDKISLSGKEYGLKKAWFC